MQTVLEKEKVPLFYYLTDALLSTSQYDTILQKALAMPDCPVVPFFGSFMREIRKIMKETPSAIVLSDQDGKALSEVPIISQFNRQLNIIKSSCESCRRRLCCYYCELDETQIGGISVYIRYSRFL